MPTLAVTVLAVRFPPSNSDGNWYILATDAGTCKGEIPFRPQENEQLILTGEHCVYHGEREFSFRSARLDIPVAPRDQLHYVCRRASGLGPTAEAAIWDRYGDAWRDLEPNVIPRVSGRVFESFRLQLEVLDTKSEEVKVVATLMGRGCSDNMAARAWATWGADTLGIVNADPFRLADLENYSFRDVDGDIRRAFGIADGDPRRVKAAVLYALKRLTDGGDTVVAWDALYTQAAGMLNGYAGMISECADGLFEDGTIKAFAGSEGVCLAGDWKAEKAVWEWVNEIGG